MQGSEHHRPALRKVLSNKGRPDNFRTLWSRALSIAGGRQAGQLAPGHSFPAVRDAPHPSPQDRGGPAEQSEGLEVFSSFWLSPPALTPPKAL